MIQLLKPFWLVISKYTAIALGVIFMLFKIRQSGKNSVKNDYTYETLKAVRFRDDIRADLVRMSPADRKRVRERNQRD